MRCRGHYTHGHKRRGQLTWACDMVGPRTALSHCGGQHGKRATRSAGATNSKLHVGRYKGASVPACHTKTRQPRHGPYSSLAECV